MSYSKRATLTVLTVGVLFVASCGLSIDTSHFQEDPTEDSLNAALSVYSDRTFLTYDRFHGTQIEYHDPNGRAFLWYPGNFRAVPSNWKVKFDGPGKGHDICWQYPTNSYNPVTKQSALGKFQCSPDWAYFPGVVQIVRGDPFDLSSGRVPFRLSKGNFTAEILALKAGISRKEINNVFRGE